MIDEQNVIPLSHTSYPWHEFFAHSSLDWVTAGWIIIVAACAAGAFMIMNDWDEHLVKRPNKRLEEWKAKHHHSDE